MSSGRILIRGVNWLGDAVMTSPALERLREAHPKAHLALLTPAKLADLWRHHPAVDQVIAIPAGENPWAVARRLRGLEFDIALILPNSHRSALESFVAHIPERIGYARFGRSFLLTRPVPLSPERVPMHKLSKREVRCRIALGPRPSHPMIPRQAHHLFHYLRLASVLGANPDPVPPRLVVMEDEIEAVREKWGSAESGARGVPLLGINPGAEYGPAKRWLPERFAQAGAWLRQKTNCSIWVFGSASDSALAARIVAGIEQAAPASPGTVQSLAGQTALRELCAGLAACDVVLTNDTGPMHLAAAVGTPVVALFGSTAPELTSPGTVSGVDVPHAIIRADVECTPCFRRECPIDFRCMNSITVDEVVNATWPLLRSSS